MVDRNIRTFTVKTSPTLEHNQLAIKIIIPCVFIGPPWTMIKRIQLNDLNVGTYCKTVKYHMKHNLCYISMVIFMVLENFLVKDLLVLMNSYGLILSYLNEPPFCYGPKYNRQQQYHMLRQTKFLKLIWSHRFWRRNVLVTT